MKDQASSEVVPLTILALFTLFCFIDATSRCDRPRPTATPVASPGSPR